MKVRYQGHSSFYFKGSRSVVTDPFDGVGFPFCSEESDFCLSSHGHFDHNAVDKQSSKVVITGTDTRGGEAISLIAIPSFHDRVGGKKRGNNTIFKFVLDNITFCHMGDFGEKVTSEIKARLGKVDVLFLPVGGVYTIDAREAVKLISLVKPKIAVPMHYRTPRNTVGVSGIDEFKKVCPFLIVDKPNEFELDYDSLPIETEVYLPDSSQF